MSADFELKMKGDHTLLSKEQDAIQSDATTRASHGLESPPEKQTDLKQAKSASMSADQKVARQKDQVERF
jgi:hypothetical protein